MQTTKQKDYLKSLVFSQNTPALKQLLTKKDANFSHLALAEAVKVRSAEMVRMLISDFQVDVNRAIEGNPRHQSVVFTACYYNFIDGVKLLVKSGARIDMQDKNGWTPLAVAAERGNIEVVDFLVNVCNADTCVRDRNGKTAFDRAGGHMEVQTILENGRAERDAERTD